MDINTLQAAKDTVEAVTKKSEGSGWIIHHIMDSHEIEISPFGTIELPHIHLFGIDLSITKHVVFIWVAAIILITVFAYAARAYKKSLVPTGVANLVEVLVVFIRDEIVIPTIGKGYEAFLPFLLTIFFFILTCNFLGLLPYGATPTSNISVTASLAALSFIATQAAGMRKNGGFGYFKGLIPHGVPLWLLPVMIVVEVLGLFTKPFALAIRLFANMTAGHVVIMALIGLIFVMKTVLVSPVSIGFALFINLLEILVAFIQAYIFTILSSLFIGMAIHQEH